jgi:disulfide oxidoreductase YuzD
MMRRSSDSAVGADVVCAVCAVCAGSEPGPRPLSAATPRQYSFQ